MCLLLIAYNNNNNEQKFKWTMANELFVLSGPTGFGIAFGGGGGFGIHLGGCIVLVFPCLAYQIIYT
jgi:hypothetical protein